MVRVVKHAFALNNFVGNEAMHSLRVSPGRLLWLLFDRSNMQMRMENEHKWSIMSFSV